MQTFRRVFAVFALLIAAGIVLQISETTAQDSACSDQHLVPFSADTQFDAACEAFTACMELVGDFTPCTPHFYAERLATCEDGEDVCVAQARLHTAMIGLRVGNGYVDHGQPDEYWHTLAANIANPEIFEAADISEALGWYKPVYDAYSGGHPMQFYSNGILQILKRNPESGFEFIRGSVWLDSTNPLLYLTRGDLYAARGDDALAALDYFMATALTGAPGLHERLDALLSARSDTYPFDYSAAQAYELYATLETHDGPGGRAMTDLSLEAPVSTQLHRYGDLLILIPGNVDSEREAHPYGIHLPLYPLDAHEDGTYSWRGEDYDDGYQTRITLSETERGFTGTRTDIVFEGLTTQQFMLALDGSDDPRPEGFRCEGAPVTRLEGAVFATPLRWWEPVQLYDEPAGTATEIEQDSQTLIALRGEPQCLDGYTWWPVDMIIESEEQAGWIRENLDRTQYQYDRIDYD